MVLFSEYKFKNIINSFQISFSGRPIFNLDMSIPQTTTTSDIHAEVLSYCYCLYGTTYVEERLKLNVWLFVRRVNLYTIYERVCKS